MTTTPLTFSLHSAMSAERNRILRDESIVKARMSPIRSQREFLVYCARQHNHLAISLLRAAKAYLERRV